MIRAALLLTLIGFLATVTASAAEPNHREGVVSYVDGAGSDYLALPIGRGHTVELCGPASCRVMTSTDIGPHQGIHPDRIADVGPSTFRELCGCPSSRGLFRGSWSVVPTITLPPTDTL